MRVSKQKITTIFLVSSMLLLFLYNYVTYIQPLYSYRGAGGLVYDIDFGIRILCLIILILVIPDRSLFPSDFFVIIFLYYKVVWFVFLAGLSEFEGYVYEYGFYIVLIGFYLMIRRIRFSKSELHLKSIMVTRRENFVFGNLYVGLAVSIFLFYFALLGWHLDFSFIGFHERRENFKNIVGSGGVSSYLYGLVQALYVLSLYLCCVRKNVKDAVALICMFSIIWGGAGERYMFIIMAFVVFLGILHNKNHTVRFQDYIIYFFILLLGFSVVEASFTKLALISDYILGRMLVVPGFISDAWTLYVDRYSFNAYCDSGLGIIWCAERTQGLPYAVSQTILGDEKMNANTDFLKFAYARGGFIGAILEASVVGAVLIYLNQRFVKTGSSLYMLFAVLFALRLVEQAVIVSFLSTGLIFLIILIELNTLKFKLGGR